MGLSAFYVEICESGHLGFAGIIEVVYEHWNITNIPIHVHPRVGYSSSKKD